MKIHQVRNRFRHQLNLATGSASSATPPQRDDDQGFDPHVTRSILQQWAEIKSEDGTVERVFTQIAQTWPLADSVKFDNIEATSRRYGKHVTTHITV